MKALPHFVCICSGILFLCLIGCKGEQNGTSVDYYRLAATTAEGFNVVVEIPAGTNHKIEFNPQSGTFENDQIDGQDRVIDFLPYPANYGFIPSTLMDLARGGDGDALDVLLIAEALPTGMVVEARPIAALLLKDKDEIDTKIIALPLDSSLQVVHIANHRDFVVERAAIQRIIENWFLHYKGVGRTQLLGWRNDQYAWAEIRKWSLPGKGQNLEEGDQ